MARRKLAALLAMALVLSLLIAPATAGARAIRIPCDGVETWLADLDPGVWSFPGGNIHVRGMVSQYEETSTCPQIAGVNTVTKDFNFDANFNGPMHGTAQLETGYNGGGVWETTWHGAIEADGSVWYEAVGQGVSGSVRGLKMRLVATGSMDPTAPSVWQAEILDPHGG